MTKVINLLAGPSAGKSTNAFKLMGYMKEKRYNVEFVAEKAKDLVWGDDMSSLDNQLHVFSEQCRRLYRVLDKVDYAITDSPLLLSLVYLPGSQTKFNKNTRYEWESDFSSFILKTFNQYNNYNFYVERGDRKFVQEGRTQNKEQAIKKDYEVLDMLNKYSIPFTKINSYEDVIKQLGL